MVCWLKLFKISDYDEMPSLEQFLTYSYNDIQQFCQNYQILSCYLPVDGTRRSFIVHTKDIDSWNKEIFTDYYETMTTQLIKLLKTIYDCGIQVVIVLLMDNSAFSRGKNYLEGAIKLGIKPLIYDNRYIDFYNQYNVDVLFSGFVENYEKNGFGSLNQEFSKLHRHNDLPLKRQLILYNGFTSSQDYIQVYHIAEQLKTNAIPVTQENLIKSIYNTNLKPYDFSIWYGFPRDKIMPPLLWEKGVKFYINRPTIDLTTNQIKKAIYYTALTKYSIKDEYIEYKINSSEQREKYKSFFDDQEDFIGIDNYIIEF